MSGTVPRATCHRSLPAAMRHPAPARFIPRTRRLVAPGPTSSDPGARGGRPASSGPVATEAAVSKRLFWDGWETKIKGAGYTRRRRCLRPRISA